MTAMWRWLCGVLFLMFHRPAPVQDAALRDAERRPAEPPAQAAAAPPPLPVRRRGALPNNGETSNFGALYHLDDLLDNLENYFLDIKLMKKSDPDAYALYSKVGAQVLSETSLVGFNHVSPAWHGDARPTFGCISMAGRHQRETDRGEHDIIPIRLIYFTKTKKWPSFVQKINAPGDLYECSAVWISRNGCSDKISRALFSENFMSTSAPAAMSAL